MADIDQTVGLQVRLPGGEARSIEVALARALRTPCAPDTDEHAAVRLVLRELSPIVHLEEGRSEHNPGILTLLRVSNDGSACFARSDHAHNFRHNPLPHYIVARPDGGAIGLIGVEHGYRWFTCGAPHRVDTSGSAFEEQSGTQPRSR